jgi:hypothetical protein
VGAGTVAGLSTAIDPFPTAISISFDATNSALNSCANTAATDPSVSDLCGVVVDLTSAPAIPPYAGHNDTDMLYVGSLAKLYPMYVAFELRRRVEMQTKKMISSGLQTATAGWQTNVFNAIKKAWQPKLDSAFPSLPKGFPDLPGIFVLSPTGDVSFAEQNPPLTDAQLDAIGEFGAPQGKYRDWMRLMLRWSNNTAASKCILPLSYPYINGVLTSAGFFDGSKGLWLSGDYLGHDWQSGPANPAGQQLSLRWAKSQNRSKSNFTGTAFQVARFLTLLTQGKLVDSPSSVDMMSIMNGVNGIGSYIAAALRSAAPPRAFTSLASKIGFGNDSFSHDCGIVTVDRSGGPSRRIRYISVILGSPPAKSRSDLSKLQIGYNDCIVARHP